jgi:hypothetical protein
MNSSAIDRAIDGERRGQAVATQCTDEGCGFPMSMRHGSDQAMAAFGPAVAPCHVGLDPGFIDENELRRGQLRLLLAPLDTRLGNIRTRLLGGMERLFLNVRLSAAKVLFIRPVLAEILCVSSSQARNSAIVASGRLATCASIAACRPPNLGANMATLRPRRCLTRQPASRQNFGNIGYTDTQHRRDPADRFAIVRRGENTFA